MVSVIPIVLWKQFSRVVFTEGDEKGKRALKNQRKWSRNLFLMLGNDTNIGKVQSLVTLALVGKISYANLKKKPISSC